jgi:hypothetical protein
MARPSQKYIKILTLRLTAEQYGQLQRQAEAAAVELSVLARSQLLKAPIPRRSRRVSPDIRALGQAVAALNRVGGNINQVIKLAHQLGDLTVYREAQQERAAVAAATAQVAHALTP